MDIQQLRLAIAKALIKKSGVKEWQSAETSFSITMTARAMAAFLFGELPEESDSMANKILVQALDGTPKQIVFADHAGDFGPTAANDLRVTTDGSFESDVEMNPGALANGSYYQSAKADLGENRAEEYGVRAAVEWAATPTAGNAGLEAWWAPSQSATAGTANAGGVSGAKGSYTGYSSNAAASVKQLQYIGAAICTAQATGTIQVLEFNGVLRPTARYGSLVILNGGGSAFHTDDQEFNLVLDPIVPEIQ